MIGTYCILPVNSAVDFLIYSMWLASTDQTLQAKKSPMEHMTPLSSSCACQTQSLRLFFFFLVCMSLCVSVCHFRVDKRIRTIPAVNPTKAKKCNFWFQHCQEELLAMDGNCDRGYKPTHLLVSELQWESMKLSQTESVLRNAARIVLVLQNTMTSSFDQYDTQVYLPSP